MNVLPSAGKACYFCIFIQKQNKTTMTTDELNKLKEKLDALRRYL